MMESLEIINEEIECSKRNIKSQEELLKKIDKESIAYNYISLNMATEKFRLERFDKIKKALEILKILKNNISYEVYEKSVKVRDDENDYEYYENELTPYIAIEIHNVDDFEIVNDWDIEQRQKAGDNKHD